MEVQYDNVDQEEMVCSWQVQLIMIPQVRGQWVICLHLGCVADLLPVVEIDAL